MPSKHYELSNNNAINICTCLKATCCFLRIFGNGRSVALLGFFVNGFQSFAREWNYLTLASKYWIPIKFSVPKIDGLLNLQLKIYGFHGTYRTHAYGATVGLSSSLHYQHHSGQVVNYRCARIRQTPSPRHLLMLLFAWLLAIKFARKTGALFAAAANFLPYICRPGGKGTSN